MPLTNSDNPSHIYLKYYLANLKYNNDFIETLQIGYEQIDEKGLPTEFEALIIESFDCSPLLIIRGKKMLELHIYIATSKKAMRTLKY